jgi:phosphoribosylformimino-5-aminoimidazole carboxamide ribotide isomerase
MEVIPAIDLMEGRVVRLFKGDPKQATFYDQWGTPVGVAIKWKSEGAQRLHIIDLDAVFRKPDNLNVVTEISRATDLPIQMGGGVRSVEAVERLLKAGMKYVILGSLAFRDPNAIMQIQGKYGSDRVIIALDNRNGMVMVEGWTSATTFTLKEALETFVKLGVKSFLITSIAKDGTLSGPDLGMLEEACKWSGVKIIAAGGIGTLKDLVALERVGVDAAVVGKALYEGRFSLKQAIETVKESCTSAPS